MILKKLAKELLLKHLSLSFDKKESPAKFDDLAIIDFILKYGAKDVDRKNYQEYLLKTYLLDKKYIKPYANNNYFGELTPDLTKYNQYRITAEGIEFATQSFWNRHKEALLVLITALLTFACTYVAEYLTKDSSPTRIDISSDVHKIIESNNSNTQKLIESIHKIKLEPPKQTP